MSNSQTHQQGWLSFIPRRGRGLLGLIAALVIVFFFGLLLSGGGDDDSADSNPTVDATAVNATDAAPADTIWTCSMHPQIKLHKPGKCPICFMDLIPLLPGNGSDLAPNQIRMSAVAKKLAQIETTPVRRAFAETQVRMVGKLAYDETRLAYITAWVPGRLDRLYADFTGIRVNRGEHMVSMYSPTLVSAQEELRQAKKTIASLGQSSDILRSTAKATVEAAREKLHLYGLTEKQIADIENADTTQDHLTIYAPVGGIVVEKQATEGMYVQTGTRIYTIADLSRLWVIFDAYESDLPWLRYGQRVSFTSPSFPGRTFTAIITFIDPTIDDRTRTAKIRAIVDNKNGLLKPDMFVSGVVDSRLDNEGNVIDLHLAGKWIGPMHPEIIKDHPGTCDVCGMDLVPAASLGYSTRKITDHEAPLIIPATAPLITGTRAVVYVEVSNGEDGPVFEGREIELGPRAGDVYVVKSGLSEGEKVVTHGAFKIDSELQIQAKPSMMSMTDSKPAPTESAPITKPIAEEPTGVTGAARAALTPVYNDYFEVQMALAKDQPDTAKAAYQRLITAVGNVDMELFHGADHMTWMKLADRVTKFAKKGAASDDIAAARVAFEDLSKAIIDLQKTFGHSDDVVYYLTYCPMAFNNKGAYWLQTEKIVWNSFFGSKMLRCGSLKDTLYATGKEGN